MPKGKGTYGKKILKASLGTAGIAFNRKKDAKGSDYKPGKRVPAIEESLYKKDDLG